MLNYDFLRLIFCTFSNQGRRQKIFQGGANEKNDQKLAKKYRKIALFACSGGVGNGKKTEKNSKKGQKIAKKTEK